MENVASNPQYPDFIFSLFKDTDEDDLNYIYRGYFTQNITDGILELTERNLEGTPDPTVIKRRVYFIMLESLQNVTRYQSLGFTELERSAIFAIQKKGKYYFITTGNLIDNSKIPYVTKQLEKVNSLDMEELKTYYKTILKNGKFTDEGGAGLGLIEMARKSGNHLSFDFKHINDDCSFFYLNTVIPQVEPEDQNIDLQFSLNNIVSLHEEFNSSQTLMVFNSGFSQENLLNLMAVIDKQLMMIGTERKRFYHIMIEMVQNIINHASENNEVGTMKSGIFFIRDNEEIYSLYTGNYILNSELSDLQLKLDVINELNESELETIYNKKLFDFKDNLPRKAGLGIIELRLKSKNRLKYEFIPVDQKHSFFILQIDIEKNHASRTI